MRQPLVAGNWKMNGSLASLRTLLAEIKAGMPAVTNAEMAVCAPAIFIPEVQNILRGTGIAWGGQDISVHDAGAYTGEIAGSMLQEFGCAYVIVGHSERREYHEETNILVAKKCEAALRVNICPILCVGETLEQREKGITENIVGNQLDAVIECGGTDLLSKAVIAYEPVWAIGTGRTATPEQAQDVHAFIRDRIGKHSKETADAIRILYGGSMKPDNAKELLAKPDIDGGLVGGASLKAGDFLAICKAAN